VLLISLGIADILDSMEFEYWSGRWINENFAESSIFIYPTMDNLIGNPTQVASVMTNFLIATFRFIAVAFPLTAKVINE
jgi:hypothetical protein